LEPGGFKLYGSTGCNSYRQAHRQRAELDHRGAEADDVLVGSRGGALLGLCKDLGVAVHKLKRLKQCNKNKVQFTTAGMVHVTNLTPPPRE
jgi:hypothetical protein